ncbi:lipoprotein [Trinickia caryophylli]|uniref:Lipoprotein-attachment site-containing protein n=1 Tax=Trinickia caryophylli TaxID=28094 RepID=A0A1X7F621_TRICW|nr:lipoprotein [Trinickia caryophylli]PMS09231.1 hypothetical protein C0Z17_25745 [Trinickia caryophylli]TRX19410.1 hypothetical protein FNF07_15060 [Trinickia caryophylli]WQE13283.1 lipoprotein [Trinickia caryophylli]SMF46100.1 lipoprotein-attachment site-containing protein [Trinickia caryophylli]
MRVVFRMSAIVAALAVAASASLAGCGQRGPLYLPTVPPLPQKPGTQPVPQAAQADIAPEAETPSATSAPLMLSPADELGTGSSAKARAPASAPSSVSAPNE